MCVGVAIAEPEGDSEGVTDLVADGVREMELEGDGDPESDGDAEPETVGVKLALLVTLSEDDGDTDTVSELVQEALADAEGDGSAHTLPTRTNGRTQEEHDPPPPAVQSAHDASHGSHMVVLVSRLYSADIGTL